MLGLEQGFEGLKGFNSNYFYVKHSEILQNFIYSTNYSVAPVFFNSFRMLEEIKY